MRRIQTFVRREGRITQAQRRALARYWPRYGLERGSAVVDLVSAFGRDAPRVLELGFGMGDALATLATEHRQWDFVGVEVYRPGIGRLLNRVVDEGLSNVRVFCDDAVAVMDEALPRDAFAAVLIFFPDPWPKKRHHKRRLVQAPFIARMVRVLEPGGRLYLATDWEDYAYWMLDALEAVPALSNAAGAGRFAPRPSLRPPSRFEQRGVALGHGIWDLVFEKAERGQS